MEHGSILDLDVIGCEVQGCVIFGVGKVPARMPGRNANFGLQVDRQQGYAGSVKQSNTLLIPPHIHP